MSIFGSSSATDMDSAISIVQKILDLKNEKRNKINGLGYLNEMQYGDNKNGFYGKDGYNNLFDNQEILPKYDSISNQLKLIYSDEYLASENWDKIHSLFNNICMNYETEYFCSIIHHISICPPDLETQSISNPIKFILPNPIRQWIILQNMIVYLWFDRESIHALPISKEKSSAILSAIEDVKSRFVCANDIVSNSLKAERISPLHIETAFRLHVLKESNEINQFDENQIPRIPDLVSFLSQINKRAMDEYAENAILT